MKKQSFSTSVLLPKNLDIKNFGHYIGDGYPKNGTIKVTLIDSREVYQISPSLKKHIPLHFRKSIDRWVCEVTGLSKRISIYNSAEIKVENALKILGSKNWKVRIPKLIPNKCETLKNGSIFYSLCFEKANGKKISTISRSNYVALSPAYSLVKTIIIFLTNLHNQTGAPCLLRDYYYTRLENYKKCINSMLRNSKLPSNLLGNALSLINIFTKKINDLVSAHELCTSIHGDLNESNILVNQRDRKIWLIDWEQGLKGGDWLMDLWKLSLFSNDRKRFKGLLSIEEKQRLVKQYIEISKNVGNNRQFQFLQNTNLLNERLDLLRIDTFLSTIILRHLMGWHGTLLPNKSGKKLKGDLFILENLLVKIIKKYISS